MNQIASDVVKGLGQIGGETGKELVNESGKIIQSVITGKDLVADAKPMGDEEYKRKLQEDENLKQKEIGKIGRDVEGEIEQVRDEKERKEKEAEEKILEEVRLAREREEVERQELIVVTGKKLRGSAFAKGKQGQASQSDMSATAEYYKKPD